MTLDVSRPTLPIGDWLNGALQRLGSLSSRETGFDPVLTAGEGRDVRFEHDPATTRVADESSFRQRTTYSASTEVTVTTPGHQAGPILVDYHANLPRNAATPAAMQALNPMDPDTWPPGTTVELRGGDFAGTPFEETFRTLAEINDVGSLEDTRLVINKSTVTQSRPVSELRVMSGPASVFDAPFEHGPGSAVLDRQDFSIHTLVQRDPTAPDQRAALNHLLLTGTQPDGSVGLSETVSADSIHALVTEVGSGEVNDVVWTFDEDGRPLQAEATLTWLPGSGSHRAGDTVENTAQADFRVEHGLDSSEHTGHILAYRFVHGHGPVNMFPQNGNFNTGAYARLENEWADWLDAGMNIDLRVALDPPGAERPDQVVVEYTVTEPESGAVVYQPQVTVFDNAAGQVYDRIARGDMPGMIAEAN
ncbi:DNA/RNA non-specific endonuclease [Coralloluteibacterium thermophilus]|uniref:DNA/RNA non-specific endonuclease n=1 Tax=Coralloluteibacterium thermophilum TaxID=2707049 RepID=A0ABV9NKS1_9GAMM